MLRKSTLLLVFLLMILQANCQHLGFSINHGKKKIRIPIEIYDNLIVVPVVVNSRLPLRFILDTGVRTTILTDKSFSDALNMQYSRKYTISAPGVEKQIEAYITNNVTLDIPGLHGEGHSMMVLAEDYIDLRSYLGTEVYGVLGYEVFSRFVVKIDYKRKMLELMVPSKFKPRKKYQVRHMVVEDTKPYVFAEVQMTDTTRTRVKLLVDTGASHGLILEPESSPTILVPAQRIHSVIGQGLGGVIKGQIARIQSLNLGTYKMPGVLANFPDPNSYRDTLKTSKDVFRNGTIGGDVLSRFTVVFDFSSEKIYFKKNNGLRKKFYLNLSGITVKAMGRTLRIYEISDVREGSPAEKVNLLKGDRIVSINDLPVDDLNLDHVIGMFNSKPGQKISVWIDRKGKRIHKEFILENQL